MRCRVSGVAGAATTTASHAPSISCNRSGGYRASASSDASPRLRAPLHAHHAAAERPGALRDRAPDVAEADDADRRARERAAVRPLERVALLRVVGLAKALPHLQQPPDRPLRHRARADAGGVRHHDAIAGDAGLHELLHARADALDPPELRCDADEIRGRVQRDERVGPRERRTPRVRDADAPRRRLRARLPRRDAHPIGPFVDGEHDGLDPVDRAQLIDEPRLVEGGEAQTHDERIRRHL